MATPNVGILTTAGKALIDKVNSGQAKISFSKVVFSSMDNSQLSDTQVKALTAIYPQEVVVSPPETTLDTTSGETRIRATGTNKQLADGVYVKTYGVFAKDETGNEVLYGVTVSPNHNYFPAYDGVTPQAVTYSYKTVIQETSNITMTNSNDVYVTQEDLTEAIGKIPQPDLSNYATQQQLATKADTSAIDPSVLAKTTLTADDDVLTLADGMYRVWKVVPKNLPAIGDGSGSDWGYITVKSINTGTRWVTFSNVLGNSATNILSGSPATWGGWHVPNSNTMATKTDVTTAISTATANMADTTKATNFTNGLQSGGVDVATAADLKSLEDASWRPVASDMYSGLCMMKYNPDTSSMSLSGTIFPKTYSAEGSRYAVIVPLPDGFSMGENTNSKATIWSNVNNNVQQFSGVLVDLNFESDGIHLIFDKMYINRSSPEMFIVLDDFFASSTAEHRSNNFINFKVIRN